MSVGIVCMYVNMLVILVDVTAVCRLLFYKWITCTRKNGNPYDSDYACKTGQNTIYTNCTVRTVFKAAHSH